MTSPSKAKFEPAYPGKKARDSERAGIDRRDVTRGSPLRAGRITERLGPWARADWPGIAGIGGKRGRRHPAEHGIWAGRGESLAGIRQLNEPAGPSWSCAGPALPYRVESSSCQAPRLWRRLGDP